MKLYLIRYILFLIYLIIPLKVYSVDYQQSVLIPSQIINGTSAVGLGAFAMSTGFALQTDIVCGGACTIEVAVSVSVDGVSYQRIPELVKTYTTTQTVVFNIFSQFYKFYKIDVTETSTNPATISVTQATKGQL